MTAAIRANSSPSGTMPWLAIAAVSIAAYQKSPIFWALVPARAGPAPPFVAAFSLIETSRR